MYVTRVHSMQVNNTKGCVVKISASLQPLSSVNFFLSPALFSPLLLKPEEGA